MQRDASSACAERDLPSVHPRFYSPRPDDALESPIQATLALSEMCRTPQVKPRMYASWSVRGVVGVDSATPRA